MKEAVLYIFVDGDAVLIEHRLRGNGQVVDILVPGGGIEGLDDGKERDYREEALFREVEEELSTDVKLLEYVYLDIVTREDTNTPFHIYLISDWEGDIPEYILENGVRDGKLEWMMIDDVLRKTKNQIARDSLRRVKEYQS